MSAAPVSAPIPIPEHSARQIIQPTYRAFNILKIRENFGRFREKCADIGEDVGKTLTGMTCIELQDKFIRFVIRPHRECRCHRLA